MGQKTNPVSLRLHYTNRHFDNCWYSNYFYKNLITKDLFLHYYLNNFLKLLKLPSGRYSIQHLQKKTQVYNFLCYSKSVREWRSKLFGLTPKSNSLKKHRYFFKTRTDSKKRIKRFTKLSTFYTTLNQITLYKIQKKITSFQNYHLWSQLIKPVNKFSRKNLSNNLLCESNLNSKGNSLQISLTTQQNLKENFILLPLVKKTIELSTNTHTSNHQNHQQKNKLFSDLVSKKENGTALALSSQNRIDNSHLLFLQNLLIYKQLKVNLRSFQPGVKAISFQPEIFSVDTIRDFSLNVSNLDTFHLKYKNYLESSLSLFYNSQIHLFPFRVKNDWQHASYLADEIVFFLEKRIPFRRLKSKLLRQLTKNAKIRGVRITCSGRVGGKSKKAQRAKIECIKYGQTSLQVFSSKIDFSMKTAFTSFGSVGVKVWICYN